MINNVQTYLERIEKLKTRTCDQCGSRIRYDECRECWNEEVVEPKRDISLTVPVRELGK